MRGDDAIALGRGQRAHVAGRIREYQDALHALGHLGGRRRHDPENDAPAVPAPYGRPATLRATGTPCLDRGRTPRTVPWRRHSGPSACGRSRRDRRGDGAAPLRPGVRSVRRARAAPSAARGRISRWPPARSLTTISTGSACGGGFCPVPDPHAHHDLLEPEVTGRRCETVREALHACRVERHRTD